MYTDFNASDFDQILAHSLKVRLGTDHQPLVLTAATQIEKERDEEEKKWDAERRQRARQDIIDRAREEEEAKRQMWMQRLQEGDHAMDNVIAEREHERKLR